MEELGLKPAAAPAVLESTSAGVTAGVVEDDLYLRLKRAQRSLEMFEIQVRTLRVLW